MIIDCFIFFNELDILEGRLEYLYNKVDYFVIVEANFTFSGKPKPLNFMNNMARFKPYLDKILYFPYSYDLSSLDLTVKLEACDYGSPHWQLESAQREHIMKALQFFKDDDFIMISDVDEIPSYNTIDIATGVVDKVADMFAVEQDLFYYNFKQRQLAPWYGTVITTNKFAKQQGPQWLRDMRWACSRIYAGGWHLSYWGTPAQIQTKIDSFSHQELNIPKFTDTTAITQKIAQGLDLFERGNTLVPVDQSSIDPAILGIFSKYLTTKMPHFAHGVEGYFNAGDFSFYDYAIKQVPDNSHIVEVGSYKGRSSSYIAVEIINSGKNIKLDCVDTWLGSEELSQDQDVVNNRLFDVFTNNMKPVAGHYTAIRLSSIEAAAQYADASLNMVFIDAAHDYDNVRADVLAWLPKVKKGGILSGHDYPYPPVRKAVDEILGTRPSIGDCWFHICN
jgi:beta-1,4-mannosyl-glycoprotein beta-1,4-N-acetylglucosaminyltransferase